MFDDGSTSNHKNPFSGRKGIFYLMDCFDDLVIGFYLLKSLKEFSPRPTP